MKPFLSEDFIHWITRQNAKLEKSIDTRTGEAIAEPRERVFWQLAKLTEETGELADAIIAHYGLQRSEKTPKDTKDAVALECADVIICTLLIARRLDIDVNNALERKVAKIDARFKDVVVE